MIAFILGMSILVVSLCGFIVGRLNDRRFADLESRLAVAEADIRNFKGVGSA